MLLVMLVSHFHNATKIITSKKYAPTKRAIEFDLELQLKRKSPLSRQMLLFVSSGLITTFPSLNCHTSYVQVNGSKFISPFLEN